MHTKAVDIIRCSKRRRCNETNREGERNLLSPQSMATSILDADPNRDALPHMRTTDPVGKASVFCPSVHPPDIGSCDQLPRWVQRHTDRNAETLPLGNGQHRSLSLYAHGGESAVFRRDLRWDPCHDPMDISRGSIGQYGSQYETEQNCLNRLWTIARKLATHYHTIYWDRQLATRYILTAYKPALSFEQKGFLWFT